MSQIYKINLLDKNNIQKIFVFKGKYEVVQGENNVTANPGNISIFSKSELNNIHKNNIQIQYIDQLIYDDDSILRIKEKILIESRGINLSINQMYLFINSEKKFNIHDTYYKLTQKETYELNINTLNGFLYLSLTSINLIELLLVCSLISFTFVILILHLIFFN